MGTQSPEIIALGGGKGGSGRSTAAYAMALSAAAGGERVLLVDTDTTCPILHNWLGLHDLPGIEGSGIGNPEEPLSPHIHRTPVDNLSLLSLGHARGFPFVRPSISAPSLMERLHDLDQDVIILDLPGGFDPVSVSLFALSTRPVLLVEPDSTGVSAATQMIRASLFHAIGYHPDCFQAQEELLMLMREQPLNLSQNTLDPPYLSAQGRRIIRETRQALIPRLLLNKTSPHEDVSLFAASLSLAWSKLLGVQARPIGHLEDAGRVRASWGPEPRPLPAPIMEAVARSLRQLRPNQTPQSSPFFQLPLVRDLFPGSPDEQTEAKVEALQGYLEAPPAALRHLLPQDVRQRLHQDLTRATEESRAPEPPPTEEEPEALAPVQSDGPDPGLELRDLRLQRGMSLRELSLRTKIGIAHLEAIEGSRRSALPRPVYLRGYLREIARVFALDEGDLIQRFFVYLGYS